MSMQSVKNALRVLEAVAENQPAGLSDLTQRLGLPKTTVQRCLTTLHEAGWIKPAGHELRRWTITGRAFSVGSQAANDRDLRSVALPLLSELQAATGETVHLMVPDGNEVVLIERLDSAHQLRTFYSLGLRSPLHATSNGKAVLAAMPDDDVADYLAKYLSRVTDRTIVDPDALLAQLATIRGQGYAVNEEEHQPGIVAIGAAICPPGAGAVGSLSVSAPKVRLTRNRYATVGRQVRDTAFRISQGLSSPVAPLP
ncbi:IclR family transcriptional regulator [Saccharopolyspora elongata]|nr:IclR family transcriptional regulator [Saccharopolyspora elongata]